jgi:hypothetical protein
VIKHAFGKKKKVAPAPKKKKSCSRSRIKTCRALDLYMTIRREVIIFHCLLQYFITVGKIRPFSGELGNCGTVGEKLEVYYSITQGKIAKK